MSPTYEDVDDPEKFLLDYARARTGRKIGYEELRDCGIDIPYDMSRTERQKVIGANLGTLKKIVDQNWERMLE
jgi:hypothetical protein